MQLCHVCPALWSGFSCDGEEKGWHLSEGARETTVMILVEIAPLLFSSSQFGKNYCYKEFLKCFSIIGMALFHFLRTFYIKEGL